jgi:chaperonin GroES
LSAKRDAQRPGNIVNPKLRRSTMAAKSKVAPLADRVVVRPLEETEQMRGGLYIPDTAKEKPQQGEVVATGPGRVEDGKRVAMEVKVGDKILYGKYSGTEVTIDAESLLILRESDILAVIN